MHVECEPHTQVHLDLFAATLTAEYVRLFETPDYAYAASCTTPGALARKMTLGLDSGSANKDGEGIRRTCKILGIPYTYKGIREYLNRA
jgi:hypothetical protein